MKKKQILIISESVATGKPRETPCIRLVGFIFFPRPKVDVYI